MRFITSLLGLAIACSAALSANAQGNPLTGAGTQDNPWQITSAADWNTLANYMNTEVTTLEGQYVKLMNDIDFTGTTIVPMGLVDTIPFAGILDGNNKTISNFSYTTTKTGQGGLFGMMAAGSVLKDVTVEGVVNGGLNDGTKTQYIGGIAGTLEGTMSNVNCKVFINPLSHYVGGLVAQAMAGSKFDECKFNGTINSGEISVNNIGGIVAVAKENCEFTGCENYAPLSSATISTTAYIGGIAAQAMPGTFTECVNFGNIVCNDGCAVAGIVGYLNGKTDLRYKFDRCVNLADIIAKGLIGGITASTSSFSGYTCCDYNDCENYGNLTATTTKAVSSSAMAGIASFINAGSNFVDCYNYGKVTNTKSTATSGVLGVVKAIPTESMPIYISRCVNMGNIESAAAQVAGIVINVPIYMYVDSCVNYGNITTEGSNAGGICYNVSSSLGGPISNCLNCGDVTVANTTAGGIIAVCNYTSTVQNCVNTGNVTSLGTTESGGYGIGGIAGIHKGTIKNCFNGGEITGVARTGGIVGQPSASNYYTSLENCVNAGKIVSLVDSVAGALIGITSNNVTRSTYWSDTNVATNCYYITDHEAYGGFNEIGNGVTAAELVATNMGEGWTQPDKYSFAVPFAAEEPAVQVCAAAVVLGAGQTMDAVTDNFNVGAPEGVQWTVSSDALSIDGNDARFNSSEHGIVELTASVKPESDVERIALKDASEEITRTWVLNVDIIVTGIESLNTDVASATAVRYFGIDGRECQAPEGRDGKVYVVVMKMNDGTVKTAKVLN